MILSKKKSTQFAKSVGQEFAIFQIFFPPCKMSCKRAPGCAAETWALCTTKQSEPFSPQRRPGRKQLF